MTYGHDRGLSILRLVKHIYGPFFDEGRQLRLEYFIHFLEERLACSWESLHPRARHALALHAMAGEEECRSQGTFGGGSIASACVVGRAPLQLSG